MFLTEEASTGDDSSLGVVLINKIGDVVEESFHRHPDTGLEAWIQLSVLWSEPGLAAAFKVHPPLSSSGDRCWSAF
jgi:hypothetical protein